MRLAEKGYSVAVIEKGKRYTTKDFPKTNWNLPKYFWMPKLAFYGFQRLDFFREVAILSGIGVGGGSIVYANTHMFPPDRFFNDPVWAGFNDDWKATLLPFYEKAKFMLGSSVYDKMFYEDKMLLEVAREIGREETFNTVDNVGIYFGDTEEYKDPYFNGLGPKRKGCKECAGCMVGCSHDAKNSLDKNYLFFAEKFGATIFPETKTYKIEFQDGMYHIHTKRSTSLFQKAEKTYYSKGLVVSAGVLGTLRLLFRQKLDYGTMSNLPDSLGQNLRTNSESLCGVAGADQKLNHGIAISRVFNPDDHTHIEICKYPDGSGLMGRLSTLATGNGSPFMRPLRLLGNIIKSPVKFLKLLFHKDFARKSLWFLVMQDLDNVMKMEWKKGLFRNKLSMNNKGNKRVPAYIDIGQKIMYRYAKKVNATPVNATTEVVMNMSSTAHILGGCPMGKSPDKGVVNEKFEVHGYPNMYILDGSIIPCNLGVNPSLTITALSEYAMSLIPGKPGSQQKSLEELMKEKKTEIVQSS